MFTGVRISAGMALLGVAVTGVNPLFSGPAEPLALVGGSALIGGSRFEPENGGTSGGTLIWQIAARADEGLTRPHPLGASPATGGRIAGPSFSRIEISPGGVVRFEGQGTPGTQVTLNRHGQTLGETTVGPRGDWQVTLETGLGVGEYLFDTAARQPGDGGPVPGGDVRIVIPKGFGSSAAMTEADDLRNRAEDLARGASDRFSEIQRDQAERERRESDRRQRQDRLAQAKPSTEKLPVRPEPPAGKDSEESGGVLFWLQDWLARANRDFQGKIVRQLQTPPPTETMRAEPAAAEQERRNRGARERADAERIAAEQAATDRRRIEEERQAAAAADARDAQAARQAEAQRRQAEQQSGGATSKDVAARQRADDDAKAEAKAKAAAKVQDDARRAANAQRQAEVQRLKEAAAASAAQAKRDYEQREREIFEAEIAANRRRAADERERMEATRRNQITRKVTRADQLKALTKDLPRAKPTAPTEGPVDVAVAPAVQDPVRRPAIVATKPAVPPSSQLPRQPSSRPSVPHDVSVPTNAGDRAASEQVDGERRLAGKRPGLRGADGSSDVEPSEPRPGREPIVARRRIEPPQGGMSLGAEVRGYRRQVATGADRQTRCRRAGRRVKPPATYVVKRGDSLWRISARHYRRGHLWPLIHRANDGLIDDPDLIFPCQRFYLPRLKRH